MTASFVDTNVLIYIASADSAKADRAEQIVSQRPAISVQVLNELTNVFRRKLRLSWAETRAHLSTLRALLRVHDLTLGMHETALDLAEGHLLSTYDAMIAAAALHCGCAVLWSEDMQHGLLLGGSLRVQNPFNEP